MVRNLHSTQKRLLELLKESITNPLTIREIQAKLDVSSPSIVQHHMRQLEKNGYLQRNPTNPYDYQILADNPEKKITYINLYGLAQCGPEGSFLDGEPIDRIPIASRILGFPSKDAFMVRARGESMTPEINDKDLVIAKKTRQANSGNLVVCVNQGEALIKKFIKTDAEIILESLNKNYAPFLAGEDFRIEGIVKSVLSYTRNKTT
jgi:repressor LexA